MDINVVVGIVAGLAIVGVVVGAILLSIRSDKKKFNNGTCPNCNVGKWKVYHVDQGGCRGYECDHCGSTFRESGWVKKGREHLTK